MSHRDAIDVVFRERAGKRRHGRLLERPGPGVGEPELGNNVYGCRVGATVVGRDSNVEVIRIVFIFRVLY